MTYSGGCFCRAVRYQFDGPVDNLCFCHCESCRRVAGASPVAWGTAAWNRFRVVHGELYEFASSAEVLRGCCPDCGTSLTYRHARRAAQVDITLCSLDDASALRPQAHIWVQDRLPWVGIDDGLPSYPRYRTDGSATES